MLGVARIPAETRWRLASRMLTFLPLAYDRALRDHVGETYNAHLVAITREVARDLTPYLTAFRLPAQTASDIADTLLMFSGVLFGPGYRTEPLEGTEKSAVMRVTQCPFVTVAKDLGFDAGRAFALCTSFQHFLIKELNPDFSVTTSRARCVGDTICEMNVRHHG